MAHYLLSDYEVEGWPIWVDTSERVEFLVKKRHSRSGAAIERAQWQKEKAQSTKKNAVPSFGERFYAVPKTVDGKALPRKKDWVALELAKKSPVDDRVADVDKMAEYRNRHKQRGSGD